MDSDPLLSIITVSAFDHTRLSETLNSMVELPGNVEHIVVTPRQDFNSLALLQNMSFGQKQNLRITYDANHGIYPAMNLGAEVARGKYLSFWNSGDGLVSLLALENLINSLAVSRPAWLIYNAIFDWREPMKLSSNDVENFLLNKKGAFISHQAIAVSKLSFDSLGGFDTKYKVASDTAMITKLYTTEKPLFFSSEVVRVEKPEFASRNHRTARLEIALIAITTLTGNSRLKAVRNIFLGEYSRFRSKLRSRWIET